MLVPLVLLGCCLYVSWTDLRARRIPNRALLVSFFLIAVLQLSAGGVWHLLLSLVAGLFPLIIFGLAALIWPRAIGMGDVKLLALLGFALGLRPFAAVLMLGSLFALLCALWMMLRRRAGSGGTLPFAPFLTLGLVLFLLVR